MTFAAVSVVSAGNANRFHLDRRRKTHDVRPSHIGRSFGSNSGKKESEIDIDKAIAEYEEKINGKMHINSDETEITYTTDDLTATFKAAPHGKTVVRIVRNDFDPFEEDRLEKLEQERIQEDLQQESDSNKKDPSAADSDSPPSDERATSETMHWIDKVVIGYNLCPFAEKPRRSNQLTSTTVRGCNLDPILSTLLKELKSRSQRPGTTLVITPDFHPDDFEKFMSLPNTIDEHPQFAQFRDKLCAIPFHPLFEWEPQPDYGNDSNSVENFVYRSPHPMIHIMRMTEVDHAMEKLDGDPEEVTYRNLRLLKRMKKKMGREKFERAMRGEYVREMDILMTYWAHIGHQEDDWTYESKRKF
jgi:hypothetical protein